MGVLSAISKAVNGYNNVRNKVNVAIEVLVETVADVIDDFSYEIRDLIRGKLKRSVIINLVTLLVYMGAMFISYFSFPNKIASGYITSVILLTLLAVSLVRLIRSIVKYHIYLICLIKNKFRIFDSVINIVKLKGGKYAVIAAKIVDGLKKIGFIQNSTLKNCKSYLVKTAMSILKVLAADLIAIGVFMVLTSYVIKPIMLKNMVGLTTIQLYIYPFAQSFDLLFHTSLCAFFGIVV